MELDLGPEIAQFRAELREWIAAHAPPALAGLADWRMAVVPGGYRATALAEEAKGRGGGSIRAIPADSARTIGTSSSGNGTSRAANPPSPPAATKISGATGTLSFQSRW